MPNLCPDAKGRDVQLAKIFEFQSNKDRAVDVVLDEALGDRQLNARIEHGLRHHLRGPVGQR